MLNCNSKSCSLILARTYHTNFISHPLILFKIYHCFIYSISD
ncbi:hypothetical protein BCAH1134_C0708 (plasmid) [Bacillus cereus AH1134]|nr:hypothetical protein BCAH1134_C0708 [Bacillus cereus AH1134]